MSPSYAAALGVENRFSSRKKTPAYIEYLEYTAPEAPLSDPNTRRIEILTALLLLDTKWPEIGAILVAAADRDSAVRLLTSEFEQLSDEGAQFLLDAPVGLKIQSAVAGLQLELVTLNQSRGKI